MDKKQQLEALIRYYSNGNHSAFASMLGLKPQTINSWKNRGTFDIELIYSKCDGVSAEWLLSGLGEMLRIHHTQSETDISASTLFPLMERKDEEIKELSKQIGRLEAENEHLQTEIESLRRENNILKKSMSTPDAEDADFAAANG